MRAVVRLTLAFIVAFSTGCNGAPTKSITLATTTSTQDTGLLDELIPGFREKAGVEVRVVAVGSGQALEIGRRGDADVLLTHDPAGEERFADEGFAESRESVMSNDFVLVGPPNDPAGVKAAPKAADAFRLMAASRATFVSRGDQSGTHQKELAVWKVAGIDPTGDWYVRSGQGMGAVLRMADEKGGYALADRGTYMAQRKGLTLVVVLAGDPSLENRYSVIVVSPKKHPHVRRDMARRFADYLLTDDAQQRIADFGREKFGASLFRPKSAQRGNNP
jgi:tungstate transport system substrate-binding protein